MISGSEIYWITRMDNISFFIGLVATLGLGATLVLLILKLVTKLDGDLDDDQTKLINKSLIVSMMLGILFSLGSIFVPTTKEMAMIKVIPAIANNEKIQNECIDIYKLAKKGLEEMVDQKSEEK